MNIQELKLLSAARTMVRILPLVILLGWGDVAYAIVAATTPPMAVDDSKTMNEDTTATSDLVICVLDNDAGTNTTFGTSPVTPLYIPSGGVTLVSQGPLSGTPTLVTDTTNCAAGDPGTSLGYNAIKISLTANASGTATFWYQAYSNDGYTTGGGMCGSPESSGSETDSCGYVTITVNAVNDAPTLTLASSETVAEDTALSLSTAVTVADVDAGSGTMTGTLTVTNGTLTASGTAVVGGTSGTSQISLSGTLAAINTALGTLSYQGSANFNGSDSLAVHIDDGGNTGSGGALTADGSIPITVTAVNDAPTLTLASSETVAEDTALSLGTAVTVADVDAGSGTMTGTLTVTNGTLTASGTAVVGGTSGTSQISLSGTLADINTALGTLSYQGNANFNGSDSLAVHIDDGGNTGSGGALTADGSIPITVTAVNDPPVLTVPSTTQNVPEDTQTSITGISVADPDADAGTAPALTATLTATNGTVSVTASGSATVKTNGTGKVTVSGTVADVSGTLGSVQYLGNLNYNGPDSLVISVTDNGNTGSGGALTDNQSVSINVTAVDDPPVLSVPGAQTATEDTQTSIKNISVTDIDADAGTAPALTATVSATNGTINVTASGSASVTTNNSSSVSISGSVADVSNTLGTVAYTGNLNFNGSDTVSVSVTDNGNTGTGGPLTDNQSIAITVSAVNDPPVVNVPAAQTVDEDVQTAITGISTSDVDADAGTAPSLTATLQVSNGTINVTASGSAVVSNNDTNKVTVSGTVAEVSGTLGSVKYTGNLNYNGSDTLSVSVNDNGNTGTGGAKTTSNSVAITVNPVNDAPTIADPGTQSATEDTAMSFSPKITIADVDAGSGIMSGTLTVSNGTLTASGSAVASGSGTASISLSGTLANINTALGSLSYQGNLNFFGTDTLQISINDNGNTGSGGALTASLNVTINVASVNDPPTSSNASVSMNEDSTYTFKSTDFAYSDAADGTNATPMSNVIIKSKPGTGTLSYNGTAVTNGQAVPAGSINLLTYTPVANGNGTPYSSFTFQVQDSSGASNDTSIAYTMTLNVTAVDDPPVLTVPGAQTITEDVQASISGISVTDVDADAGTAPALTATLTVANGTINVTAMGSASVTTNNSNSVSISGSVSDVSNTLGTVNYTGNLNFNGSDTLNVSVTDNGNTGTGGPLTDNQSVPITVTAVNDPPVLTVPGAQSIPEDVQTAISGISVADPDADAGTAPFLSATLTTTNGTINVTASGSASVTSNNSKSVSISGTVAEVSGTLASVKYTGDLNYNGSDTLSIAVTDNGNTGSGGPLTDNQSVSITVTAVDDPPVLTVPSATQSINEDTLTLISGISVTDVDADAGTPPALKVALQANNGRLNVQVQGAATVTLNNTKNVVVEGSVADVSATLGTVRYLGVLNYNGPDTLTVSVTDNGNTGSGGPLTDQKTIAITVNPVNDAPTITAPATATVDEDTALPAGSSISIGDVDAGSGTMTGTLSVTNGTLTASGTAVASGSGTTSISLSGTLADINTALSTLVYQGNANYYGTDTLNISIDDGGNTGSGGPLQASASVAITINSVDDPPVVAVPGAQSVNEDSSLTVNGISVADVDADVGTAPYLTVTLSVSNGTVAVTASGAATVTGSPGASVTVQGTVADVSGTLGSVIYTPTANYFGTETLTVLANDNGNTGSGGPLTDSKTVTITVNGVNDPPVLTVPGAQSATEDTPLTVTGVSVVDVDADAGTAPYLTVTIGAAHGTIGVTASGSAAVTGNNTGSVSVSGAVADVSGTLGSMVYTPNLNYSGSDTISLTANDNGNTGSGGALTDTKNIAVTISGVNDPPVLTAPASQSLPEDVQTAISGISVTDPDADNGTPPYLSAAVSVASGTVNVTASGAATVTNNNTATVTITGTVAEVSGTLGSILYTGNLNFNGADSMVVTVSDNGNTGSGGVMSDSKTINITVTAVNDPPVVTAPATATVLEDNPVTITGISASDVDAAGGSLTATLSVNNGVISVTASGSATVSGNGSALITVNGKISNLSNTISSVNYQGNANFNGTDSLTVTVNDNGNTGSGGAQSDTKVVAITVTPVNDAPSFTLPASPNQTVNEDAGLQTVSSFANGSAGPANESGQTLIYTVTNDNSTLFSQQPAIDSSGTLTYQSAPNWYGTATVTVNLKDNGGIANGGVDTDPTSQTFTITVNSVNDPPVYNNTFTNLNVNEDSGTMTLDLGSAFSDADIGILASDSLTYTVTFVDKPDPYVTTSVIDYSGMTGATISSGTPTAGQSTVTYTTTGTSLLLPLMKDAHGSVDITVTATDQGRPPASPAAPVPLSAQGSFSITVNALADDTPQAVDDSYTTNPALIIPEDSGPLTFDPTLNDYPGDAPVHVISVGAPFTDSYGVVHAYRSQTRMADPNNTGDMHLVADGEVSCADPGCQNGQTSDTAVDGSGLGPTQIVYQPGPNFNGIDHFTYCIQDSTPQGEAPFTPPNDPRCATITIEVTPVDDPPVPQTPIQYTVVQGNDLVVPVSTGLVSKVVDLDNSTIDGLGCSMATDPTCPSTSPHPDTLYFRLDSATTANGQMLPPFANDGSFQYRPNATFSGDDTFTFDVCDINDFTQASHCVYNVQVDIAVTPAPGAATGSSAEAVQFDFQLAEVPLELPVGPDPNVLIINDDSGSMNWDMLTPDPDGVYYLSNGRTVDYVLTATAGYSQAAASEEADPGEGLWRLRDPDYNAVYYNPQVRYMPWKGLDANGNPWPNSDPSAARNNPLSSTPTTDLLTPENYQGTGVSHTQTCKQICRWWGCYTSCTGGSNNSMPVTNYYIPRYYNWTDKNGNGLVDATPSPVTDPANSEGALVEIKPASAGGSDTYPKGPNRSDCVTVANECTYAEEIQNFANWFTYSRNREYTAKSALGQVVTAAQSMRIGYAKLNSKKNIMPITEMNSSERTGAKAQLLNDIYATTSSGGTPLRRTLRDAGRYFACQAGDIFGSTANSSPGDATCPVLAEPQGNCQQNFTLLMTDGTWNGPSPGVGNADADNSSNFDGGMFAGSDSNTLADVAMYYYENDLQPTLPDEVPTTARDKAYASTTAFANGGNDYMHQHMTTYTIGFGAKGTVKDSDLPTDYTQAFAWPSPSSSLGKIDDLHHAAVNGRGQYLNAGKSGALADSLIAAFQEFATGIGTGAAVSFNSQEITQNTLVFRAYYNTKTNTGDLVAIPLTQAGLGSTPKWQAAIQMDLKTYDQRAIMTLDPDTGTGIPFRPDSLTTAQRAIFISNPAETAVQQETEVTEKVNYLRGDSTYERPTGNFRERPGSQGRLGDIVHSKPVFVGPPSHQGWDKADYPQSDPYSTFASNNANRQKMLFVGANDGMVHAFNADTGDELFAYVPNNLMLDPFSQRITNLIDYNYSHKFFVDLTPAVNDVYIDGNGDGTKEWQTVLVGGQGAGAKAYYALNITDPTKFNEADASSVVMWEFTQADDTYPTDSSGVPLTTTGGTQRQDLEAPPQPVKDLGYTYSVPTIAMSNLKDANGNNKWVVLFGNGYNSTAGIAKLFVLFMDRSNKTVWCHPDMIYNQTLTGGTMPAECVGKQDFVKLDTGFGVENGYPNGLGTPRAIDVDANGTVDYVYAGDLFGNFFRFDLTSSDFHNWTVTKIFKATYTDSGGVVHDQPITTQPIVTLNPQQQSTGYLVIFATGSYITVPDGTDTSIQSIYGLWDRLGPTLITKSNLVQQYYTNLADTTYGHLRTLSNNPVDYTTAGAQDLGWYNDLDAPAAGGTQGVDPAEFPGERAIRNLQLRGGLTFVNSIIPHVAQSCIKNPGGFALSFCPSTGSLDCLKGQQLFDVNNDGYIDANDQVSGQTVAAMRFDDAVPTDSAFIGSQRVTQLADKNINITGTNTNAGSHTGRLSWKRLSTLP